VSTKDLFAPDDTRDALRKYGGLLFGLGMLMVALRKENDYSDFVLFLVYGIPAVFLYGEGVFTDKLTGGIRPWQAVYSVFGLIFVPLALGEFVEMLDGEVSGWNTVWIFGVTAGLAFYAGAIKGIRFHLLAGSIAAIITWSALWNELLSDGIARDFGIYRGLLGILAILLLAGALYLWREDSDARVTGTATESGGDQGLWKASELITGAGISAVLACSLGVSSFAQFLGPFGVTGFTVIETAAHWDIALLLVSLGLVGLGSTIGTRGPVYIGAIGLLLFLFIVGYDLDGDPPTPTKLGIWPIVLIVLGLLAAGLGSLKEASLGDRPRQFVQGLKKK
jgi:hypothetical protein